MDLDPARAAHAVASAGDAIVTVDGTATIASWNGAAERLFGYSHKEAIGESLALIIPAADRARHVAAFHKAMDSGQLAHGGAVARVEATTKAGDLLVLGMSLGLLRDGAGVVAVLRRLGNAAVEFVPEGSS
jgi:PAS domain S-box-containing protein